MKKNKIAAIGLLCICLPLTSCGYLFKFIVGDDSSSSSTLTSNIFQTSITSSEINPNDLLVYKDGKPLSRNKGGYVSSEFSNSEVANLAYDYKDYTNNSYYYNIDSAPSTGEVNLLVVPVHLANYDYNVNEATREKIYNAYFGDSTSTGFESVSSYFYKSSYGTLKLSGVVTPWYHSSYTYYINSETQVMKLADDALTWYKENFQTDAKEFDSDSNGFIDCICLIYNVPSSYRNNDNLWAYTYWANNQPNLDSPNVSTFFWASVSFMDESVNCKIDAHTYIHEMGHAFGLDDYYNYDDYSTENAAGGFIMQSHNVGDHDPYSKMALGWVNPLLVTGDSTIKLHSFTETGECIVLKTNDSMNSPFDEYLVIELYTPTNLNEFDSKHLLSMGYPKGPNQSGIRIWHVDSRLMEMSRFDYNFATEIKTGSSYLFANSNSTDSTYGTSFDECKDYRLLHLLEADNRFDFKHGEYFSNEDMWYKGDNFTLSKYSQYFSNYPYMNNYENFNYSITINDIVDNVATVKITKG